MIQIKHQVIDGEPRDTKATFGLDLQIAFDKVTHSTILPQGVPRPPPALAQRMRSTLPWPVVLLARVLRPLPPPQCQCNDPADSPQENHNRAYYETCELPLLQVHVDKIDVLCPAVDTDAERSAMNSVSSAPSTNEMARQPVYETTLGPRVKQRGPDQGPDRPSQSPAITLLGQQQQPRAGPLRPKPPPHQGSSRSAPVSSITQQQPVPTPHGSSSSGGGNPSAPTPATRDHDPVFRQASAAIDQSHPPPWSPTSAKAPAGAVAVKRNIHAGVKALFQGSVRRPRHSGHRNEAPPQNGSDHALQPPRAPPPADSLPSYPCDSPRKPEEKRGRPAAPPTKINGAPSKGISPTPPETYNAERQDNRRQDLRAERNTGAGRF
ncbi:basic proline-rich protein-like [Dermacentor silvarum]|uniref:basic proline-rich protein-like n=1 Tax=Dermacentor silvarum TaxID=543639 RepID=UPI0018992BC9|nr:basic proline-rich protein-like [Dermacentor silvarum]